MKPLPIILVDMDGVFCDFLYGYYEVAKNKFPEVYAALPRICDVTTFYVEDMIADPDLRREAEHIVDDPDLFLNLPPILHAVSGMKELKEKASECGLDVFICTAPHRSNKQSYSTKANWVEKYLGYEWLNKLLIVRDKTVCNGLILLDDKPKPLGNFTPTWKHVLVRQSYNVNEPHEHVMRDWSSESITEIVSFANKLNNS